MHSITSPGHVLSILKLACSFHGQSTLQVMDPVSHFGYVLLSWEKRAKHFENCQQGNFSGPFICLGL